MTRKYDDLPFKVGQEVEAKFNENGYRGAWFRCRISEIKDSGAIPKLLLQYLDFPGEADSWAAVRRADPAVKDIEPWLKQKKPLIWMVRPEPPVIHESNVDKYQEDVVARKCPGNVHIYNDMYMVGDQVDWLKDYCFWGARIVEIDTETNVAKLKFPFPPLGEGDGNTHLAPLKDLRPSFSWNPKHGWRQLGLKKKEAGTGVVKCKGDKPHIQLAYLSGDSMTPAVVSDDRCGPFSSGNTSSICKSESDHPAVNSRATLEKERHINSDSHELDVISDRLHEESKCVLVPSQSTSDACHGTKEHNVYDRLKLRNNTTIDGAKSSIKQEAPDQVMLEKGWRRKVRFTSSFDMSDSDKEEQRSWPIPQNALSKQGARSSTNEMVLRFEVLNLIPSTTHVLRLDASTTPSQPVASSPTGEFENIDGVLELDTTPEHLRNCTAAGDLTNDSVAAANEDIPQVKFVIPDTALENGVSATRSTPINADDRNGGTAVPELIGDKITLPVGSPGSCLTMENADGLGDQTADVDGDGTSDVRPQALLLVPGNVLENSPSPDSIAGCADALSGARAEVYSPAHDGGSAPQEEVTDSVYDFDIIVAEDATSESRFEMRSPVSAETSTALKNPLSTDSTTAHPEEITEIPHDFEGVVAEVQQSAPDHGTVILVPDGTQVPLKNTTRDDNHGESEVCAPGGDLNEEQATGSAANVVTKDASAPLSGRLKFLSHRSCVAIKKAIDIGRSRKRRREKDQLKSSRKWSCQIDTSQGVTTSVFQADALTEEPLSSSVPPTPTNNEKRSSVFGSIVKPEPGTYEEENRMHVLSLDDPSLEPLWVLALPRIREEKFPAVTRSAPSTTPSDTEQQRPGNSPDFNCVRLTAPSDTEQQHPGNSSDFNCVHVIAPIDTQQQRPGNSPDFNCILVTAPSDTEHHQCPPDPTENSDLEDDLDALERLIARVHVLGANLRRDKVQKRKKVAWKISDGSVFFSGEGEGSSFDDEAKDLDVTPHSGDNSGLNYVPKWYLRSVFAAVSEKALDGEADTLDTSPCSDPDYVSEGLPCVSPEATNIPQEDGDRNPFKVSLDSSVVWGRKSRSRRKVTKRGTKRMKSVRNLGTCKSQSLRQSEPADQLLLLGSGNVCSKVNGGFKRKQVDNRGPGKDGKKMRADVSTALVEAVRNSPTPASEVELPRMRGSITHLKGKPVRLKISKTSQKPSSQGKYLDANMARKEQVVESGGFQREQQLENPICGHFEQKSVEKSSLSGFPTKSHLSSGSKHDTSSLGKLDSEVLDNDSEENKIKLQPNGNWCIKAFTVDGKVEWIGNFTTKEEALNLYDVINRSSSLKGKGVPPPSHTSFSCLREQEDGSHLNPEPALNEKQLMCSTLATSTEGNASESNSTAVEPNVESTLFVAKQVNETAVGVSRPDKTSGVDEQEGEGQDAGALEIIDKPAETCEQDSSVISTKEDPSVGLGVETNSAFSIGDIQGRTDTGRGATAPNLTEGPLGLSSREKVVNADKDIQSGGIVQDKPVVKVEVSEPQAAAAAAGSPHDSWIHDAMKCRYGKDALDRVSMNNFETTKEMEVARQVKTALWRGLCCSRQSCGLGLDLFKRIQLLLQSRMLFQTLTDGDSHKILLTTGKPGEEIYLGRYKNETEFGAARRIISRCKKVLQKSMAFFEAPHNAQVTSDVLQTKVPHAGTSQVISVRKESSSSLPESTEQRTRPTSATQATGEPVMQGFTISRESGQSLTRSEISPKPFIAAGDSTSVPTSEQIHRRLTLQVTHNAINPSIEVSTAPVTDHLPSLNERQAPVTSGAVAGPPRSSQNVIVLDDDDDDEVHVAPVTSSLLGSTSARAFTGATHVGNNVSAQREGNQTSRTYGLLNDVVSSYPCQTQEERFHLAGGSSAGGRISVRQTVPNHFQTVNTGIDPMQRVGQACGNPDAQICGRSLLHPVRQEGLRSQQTVATPFLFGNVVGQLQPVNQHVGTVRINVVNSIGRLVEIPSSSLQAMQGPVRVSTSHVPVNRPRELGNSTSVPTAFNISATTAPRSTSEVKVYSCCPGIVISAHDFMLFKALCCTNCNQTVHTYCAIASRQLAYLVGSNPALGIGKEKAVYICCACGKKWEIIPMILSRMKDFIEAIWNQQKERLDRDAPPITVIDLQQGPELLVIVGTLHKILSGARSDHALKTIFQYVQYMNWSMWEDANKVNFLEWITFIKTALKLVLST